MRKLVIFGLYVCASPSLGHSQSNINQLPNGVVVHQAQGVEKASEVQQAEQSKVRTIQDLNLSECIDALTYIEHKLNKTSVSSEIEYYLNEKALITKRINELKSSN